MPMMPCAKAQQLVGVQVGEARDLATPLPTDRICAISAISRAGATPRQRLLERREDVVLKVSRAVRHQPGRRAFSGVRHAAASSAPAFDDLVERRFQPRSRASAPRDHSTVCSPMVRRTPRAGRRLAVRHLDIRSATCLVDRARDLARGRRAAPASTDVTGAASVRPAARSFSRVRRRRDPPARATKVAATRRRGRCPA